MQTPLVFLLIILTITIVSSNELKLSYHDHGTVSKDKITQFYLPTIPELSNTNKLVFVIFPLSGDCHLYVSSSTNATKTEYHWKSTHTGPNYITVKKNDRNYKTGNYFVSVFGEWDSKFKVLAYINDMEEIDLHDGEPQVAEVEANQNVKFTFNLKEKKDLMITLANFNGYHRFVINTEPNPEVRVGKYKWIGSGVANEALTIKTTDRNFIYGVNATYYISVFGYSAGDYKRTEFQLGVRTEGQTDTLSEGLPQISEVVSGGYQFYEYQLSSDNDVWLDIESEMWGGSPYMCISTQHQKPTVAAGQCTWKIERSLTGINSYIVNKTDPNWKKSTYYIGVNGWPENWERRNYKYLITAATRLQSKLMLNGKILTISQANNEIKWFRYFSPYLDETLFLAATPSKGRVEFYVSKDASNMHPDSTNYDFKSWGVTIARLTMSFEGWIYIGVAAFGDSTYTFDIHNVHTVSLIRINRQINNHVQIDKYHQIRYFYTNLPPPSRITEALVVGMTAYSGKGTVYISKDASPSPDNYIWKSEANSFYIPKDMLIQLNITNLYFGIRSESEVDTFHAHFSLYFPSASLRLQNNIELQEVLQFRQERYYAYFIGHDGRMKIFTRTEKGSSYVFISNVPNPNSGQYLWYYYLASPGESRTFNIEYPDQETTYYITVLNYALGNNTFTIKINTDYESLQLEGKPIRDDIRSGERRLYRLWYSDISRFMVSTSLITGRTAMYIVKGDSIPSQQNNFGFSLDYPGNVFYLSNTTNEHERALWTIGIYALEDSDYYISSQSEMGDIELGIPVTGKTKKGDLQFYHVSIEKQQIVFIHGIAAERTCTSLYFSQTEKKPNVENSKWKVNSVKMYNHHIFFAIKSNELDINIPHLYIGVESCEMDNKYHPYEFSVTHQQTGMFLFQEYNKVYADGEFNDVLRNYNFFVNNNNFTKGFHLYMDSCTNLGLGFQTMGSSDENATFPITFMNAEFSAKSSNTYHQSIEISGNRFANKKLKLTLGHQSSMPPAKVFSIFTSTEGYDTRPQIHYMNFMDLQSDKPEIRNSLVELNATSKYYPLKYEVFARESDIGLNMRTPCGIRYNQAVKIHENTATGGVIFYARINLMTEKSYWINVIVTDALGRENSHEFPMYIMKKTNTPPRQQFNWLEFGRQIYTIVTIIIATICGEIVLYLVFGMLYKKLFLRAKGIEMIPNIEFWRSVTKPFWSCCGVKQVKSGYVDLDEPKSSEPNPFE